MENVELSRIQITVKSSRPFDEVLQSVEAVLGFGDVPKLQKALVESKATPSEVAEAVSNMLGSSGLMYVAKVNQGVFLSLFGKLKRSCVYLLANPILASPMFDETASVGEYLPVRFSVYEDAIGKVVIVYDKLTPALAYLHNDVIDQNALEFDRRLAALALTLE